MEKRYFSDVKNIFRKLSSWITWICFQSSYSWFHSNLSSKFFKLLSSSAKGIGCFRDTGRRAIATMEGRSRLLKGNYQRRLYAIQKCAMAALRRRYRVFALQNGGWCASSRTAYRTFARYGRSKKCRNGKGGPWANDVYVLQGRNICFPFAYISQIIVFL